MKSYLCLLAGIHDVPGNRRHGETVLADSAAAALLYAASRYGLHSVPAGSTATPVTQPPISLPVAA